MVNFNVPPYTGNELLYIQHAIENHKTGGDGEYTKKCSEWIENRFHTKCCMLTTSGTTGLEIAARLCEIKPGDEVIMPSYTYPSTANAFVMMGARIVFVDIRPDTMNIDETKIEHAITPKTRAIVPEHYAGVGCEMDTIMAIARDHNLKVVEDAAQDFMGTYKGKALGTIGDFGAYSFHETKNYSMGEGGAILVNENNGTDVTPSIRKLEVMRSSGTNRAAFMRGEVDKYTWIDFGSSSLPSDMLAAFLWAQLEHADEINADRLASWHAYHEALQPLADSGRIEIAKIPEGCKHNAHMFWLKCADLDERTRFLAYLREHGVNATFHYQPLHTAPAGMKFGRFDGKDEYTTRESERIARLPMYYGMTEKDRQTVIDAVQSFYKEN